MSQHLRATNSRLVGHISNSMNGISRAEVSSKMGLISSEGQGSAHLRRILKNQINGVERAQYSDWGAWSDS